MPFSFALSTAYRLLTCLQILAIALLLSPAAKAADLTSNTTTEAVSIMVEEYLIAAAASSYPGTPLITVDASRVARQPDCDQLQVFLSSGQRLRSRMSVGVRCMAPTTWSTYVQASLSIQGYYYLANRLIQPGELLSLDDLSAREGDLLKLSAGIATDPSLLIGYIASQRIPAGTPLKTRALRDPDSIQRGQMIRTEVRGPGFVATGEGQAMQNGNPGEQIQIKSSSGQIITGTVLNSSTALVM